MLCMISKSVHKTEKKKKSKFLRLDQGHPTVKRSNDFSN